jgi:uncharacterized protein YuzE
VGDIRVTYDSVANAVYIYLDPTIERVARTYPCDPIEVNGMINLDFDSADRLVGIEVLDARARLPASLIEGADQIG